MATLGELCRSPLTSSSWGWNTWWGRERLAPAAEEALPRVGTGLAGKLSEYSHTGQMVGVVCQALMEKRRRDSDK